MANNKISDLLRKLKLMEQEEALPKASEDEFGLGKLANVTLDTAQINKNVTGKSTGVDQSDAKDTSRISGLDVSASKDHAKVVNLTISEAEGDDEDENKDPDLSGENADMDSELNNPFVAPDEDSDKAPVGDDSAEDGDDKEQMLASIGDLIRAALGDDSLSVSIGLNLPGAGGDAAPAAEPPKDETPADKDTIEDATTPASDPDSIYGDDDDVMERFLEGIGDEKKNSEDDNEQSEPESEDDDEDDDSTVGSGWASTGNSAMGY